ncbi:Holliday junction resolvase RuvX [Cupriavidus sp. RAF12]|uniref:Holliday junction resolvase RuvX n=1 Tax=Cupriavidus sp. RAF12 TaxID=3233050 RepID=UPI003F908117
MPDQPGRETPHDGTVLAFDYGEKKIGVALGNFITRQASALTILPNITVEARFEAIGALIREWSPVRLVVGMPVNPEAGPDDEEQASMRLARRFCNQLNGRFGLPVEWVDERYSSRAAAMAGARRGALDAEAARIILQQYFDEFPL